MAKKLNDNGDSYQGNLFGRSQIKHILKGKKCIKLPGKLPPLDVDWMSEVANSPAKDSGYTRTYYSYPAKFQAHLPNALISSTTRPGNLICDPYCGGGTTGLESLLINRRFVGYDLNPFAILISRVKTTRLVIDKIDDILPKIIGIHNKPSKTIFDNGDRECIGDYIADELDSIACNIESYLATRSHKLFLKLALIHTIKLVGRRDFTRKSLKSKSLFDDVPSRSAIPMFKNKVKRMLLQMATLPHPQYKPRFVCASNHHMKIDGHSVDLIVTSPPYKDLDVEYGLIQLQRREFNRSKRSEAIFRILGTTIVKKNKLCGDQGDLYWKNLQGTLKECKRILKHKHLAFFWVGFKNQLDQDTFCDYLNKHGLPVESIIPVRLSHDRVASSRSTHHGKDTGMMKRDCLIVTRST
ncbi:DNA methyltransferase [Planctomycetota bacterium]